MTDADLADLLAARTRAWEELGVSHQAIRDMRPSLRARMDAASRRFRSADAAIVAELRRRPGPVRLGDVELWLTQDGCSYAECDPETGAPVCCAEKGHPGRGRLMLHDYPGSKTSRKPA